MNIPKEIQGLMPERKPLVHDVNWAEGYNAALKKVEAVLPQIISLAEKRGEERMKRAQEQTDEYYRLRMEQAEKRGAEGAWKEAIKLSNEIEIAEPDGGIRQWIAFKRFRNTIRDKYITHLNNSK